MYSQLMREGIHSRYILTRFRSFLHLLSSFRSCQQRFNGCLSNIQHELLTQGPLYNELAFTCLICPFIFNWFSWQKKKSSVKSAK